MCSGCSNRGRHGCAGGCHFKRLERSVSQCCIGRSGLAAARGALVAPAVVVAPAVAGVVAVDASGALRAAAGFAEVAASGRPCAPASGPVRASARGSEAPPASSSALADLLDGFIGARIAGEGAKPFLIGGRLAEADSNHRRRRRLIYSQLPLSTRAPAQTDPAFPACRL